MHCASAGCCFVLSCHRYGTCESANTDSFLQVVDLLLHACPVCLLLSSSIYYMCAPCAAGATKANAHPRPSGALMVNTKGATRSGSLLYASQSMLITPLVVTTLCSSASKPLHGWSHEPPHEVLVMQCTEYRLVCDVLLALSTRVAYPHTRVRSLDTSVPANPLYTPKYLRASSLALQASARRPDLETHNDVTAVQHENLLPRPGPPQRLGRCRRGRCELYKSLL
ncbi:hypothetical protein B0H21DRAFT_739098 [Amylocystis lapponica]|nr:hypothetical protein B0H21DRAFT_739098 [Amylocystis lapponica]